MKNQPAKAGWYPDPCGTPRQRFFNGTQWTEVYDDFGGAPANDGYGKQWADNTFAPLADNREASKQTTVGVGVVILGIIGLVMSMQSTSLLNGTGNIWLGVALVGVALAVSFIFGGATWAKVMASIMLVLALVSAFYMEDQMNKKRIEISHVFDSSFRS